MGDVIQANFADPLTCKAVLTEAIKAKPDEVLIITLQDGDIQTYGSNSYMPEVLWMLERAKHKLMQTADVQESCPMDVA